MIFAMGSMRETICNNFNRIMGEHPDMGPAEIADAAGVHRSMIYKWRDGENVPDPDKVDLLAKLFRVEPVEFYKSEVNVIQVYGNLPLRKYLYIPDKVVELAMSVPPSDEVWGVIEGLLEQESQKLKKKNKA